VSMNNGNEAGTVMDVGEGKRCTIESQVPSAVMTAIGRVCLGARNGRGVSREESGRRVSDLVFGFCGFAGSGRFPVFATCPAVILAHSQTIADQGEKKDRKCEFHSSGETSSTASSPWPQSRFAPGPCNQDSNGAACWSLVAQAPGQQGAFVPTLPSPGGLTPNL